MNNLPFKLKILGKAFAITGVIIYQATPFNEGSLATMRSDTVRPSSWK